jgi:hypothetical protein
VHDKRARARIQAEAANKGWPEAVMYAAIKERKIGNPTPKRAGRKRKEPGTPVARLRFRLTKAQDHCKLCLQACRELGEVGVGAGTARQLSECLDTLERGLVEMRKGIGSATR